MKRVVFMKGNVFIWLLIGAFSFYMGVASAQETQGPVDNNKHEGV